MKLSNYGTRHKFMAVKDLPWEIKDDLNKKYGVFPDQNRKK